MYHFFEIWSVIRKMERYEGARKKRPVRRAGSKAAPEEDELKWEDVQVKRRHPVSSRHAQGQESRRRRTPVQPAGKETEKPRRKPPGDRRTKEAQQRHRKRLKKRKRGALALKIVSAVVLLLVLAGAAAALLLRSPVEKQLVVEAGSDVPRAEDFLKKSGTDVEFITDMSGIDMAHVGEYEIALKARGKERTSTLIIEDTKAPAVTAVGEAVNVPLNGKADASLLVESVDDATDVTYSFKEEPDLTKEGEISVTVVVTDEGGNTAEVSGTLNVILDEEPPVIDGVAPLTGFVGDPISYKAEITVTDNYDNNVELEVDASGVDMNNAGTYEVVYTATDQSGNTATATARVTLTEKPDDYVEPEEVDALADEVLAEITTDDMTLKEKARAIYSWAKGNIGYINHSEKESWTNGAYQGFTQRQGDCFVYYSTARALLTRAGIPNIGVEKSDTSHSSHYWSLIDVGDGWYHFDTTPRYGGGEFFLLTDQELEAYSSAHNNSHIFDHSQYPATPTKDSTVE